MRTEICGGHVARGRGAGRGACPLALILTLATLLSLCAVVAVGCTSEEDLVRTLQTEQDATVRQTAAADLASRHSVAATLQLVTAAAADATASAGLDSLADEYALSLAAGVQKAADEGKAFDEDARLALEQTVDCLGCAGNATAVEHLGKFASNPGRVIPDTADLQLRCVQALTAIKSDAAMIWLGELVGKSGAGAGPLRLATAAQEGLEAIGPPAVEVMVGALADKQWADEVLVAMGAPAVPRLAEDLQDPDPAVRYKALGVLLLIYKADSAAVAGTLVAPEMVPLLVEVRTEAGYDESQVDSVEAVLEEIGQPAVATLLTVIPEQSWATDLLVRLGAGAVPELVAALGTLPCAESVLASIGAPTLPAVAGQLDSADELVRHRAIGVLLRMYESAAPEVDGQLLTEAMVPRLLADLMSETAFTEYEGYDHVTPAEMALVDIGEPAIAPILACEYEYKWWLLQCMEAPAVPALTAVMTGKERDDALSAAATLAMMGETAPAAVAAFTTALENEDLEYIAVNYLYYIALGQAGSEEVISRALLAHGKKQMGLDCLNSGNETLDEAGRQWARNHGYTVYSTDTPGIAMPWGGN